MVGVLKCSVWIPAVYRTGSEPENHGPDTIICTGVASTLLKRKVELLHDHVVGMLGNCVVGFVEDKQANVFTEIHITLRI